MDALPFNKIIHSHRLVSGRESLVSGDSREGLASDKEEEKLLKQAIALSLEGSKENDKEEENKNEEDEVRQLWFAKTSIKA